MTPSGPLLQGVGLGCLSQPLAAHKNGPKTLPTTLTPTPYPKSMATTQNDQEQNSSAVTPKPRRPTAATNSATIESMRQSFDTRLGNIETLINQLVEQRQAPTTSQPSPTPAASSDARHNAQSDNGDPLSTQSSVGGPPAPTLHLDTSNHVDRSNRYHPYGVRPSRADSPAPPLATAAAGGNPALAPFLQRPAGREPYAPMAEGIDPDIDDKVRSILESTAHHISTRGKRGIYPHQYIFRGAKKEKASLGELTLAEHAWGIMRIVEDSKIPSEIKPHLVSHLDDLLEDAREYTWANVRQWSEEIFALISEGRMKGGWSNDHRIQMLRMSISRTNRISSASSSAAGSAHSKHQQAYPRQTTQGKDMRGGPPCKDFNTSGCSLPGGHIVDAFRRPHICSYCLVQLSSIHPHAEKDCQIKLKQSASSSGPQTRRHTAGFRD